MKPVILFMMMNVLVTAETFPAEQNSTITLSCPINDPKSMINVNHPSGLNALHCASFNSCSNDQASNYVFEGHLSNTSILMFSIKSVRVADAGNWTCRNGGVDVKVFQLSVSVMTTTLHTDTTQTTTYSGQQNLQPMLLQTIILCTFLLNHGSR